MFEEDKQKMKEYMREYRKTHSNNELNEIKENEELKVLQE